MSIAPPQQLHHRVIQPEVPRAGALPLVLVHGLMGFAANWGKIWPQFANRPVLVFDQRGHGRSPKPLKGYSPADYAADLDALIRSLGWERCHIVGHSMGGRVALEFAATFPQLAATLTMEDSGAEANPTRVEWIRNLLGSIPTPFADRDSAKAFFAQRFRDDPLTGSFLHANLESKEDGSIDWRFHAPGMIETVEAGRAQDGMKQFSSLTLPTLLIRGGHSREFPRAEAVRMQESRPGVTLVEIEGAGHYVHAEKPVEFGAALTAFLTENE